MSDDPTVDDAFQMCDAPADAFSAGDWCHAANVLKEALTAAQERVAAALYELAMKERAVCLSRFKYPGAWWREPYVGPLADGESRPTNWRDGWREKARLVLAAVPPADTTEGTG